MDKPVHEDPDLDEHADKVHAEINEAYINDLVADARLYATYGRYAGSFKDEKLFQTIANALRERPISNRLVVELQRILNETAKDIPFSTMAAMKAGWTPGQSHWLVKAMTFGLVLISVLLMVVVARLTLVHNEGVSLIVQAEALIEDRPQQTIDRLLREHILARLQMDKLSEPAAGVSVIAINDLPNIDTVSLTLIEANEAELSEITRRMTNIRQEIGSYITSDAIFPLMGMREVFCFFGARAFSTHPNVQSYCAANLAALSAKAAAAERAAELAAMTDEERAKAIAADAQAEQERQEKHVETDDPFVQLDRSEDAGKDTDCYQTLDDDEGSTQTGFRGWQALVDKEVNYLVCMQVVAETDFRGVQFNKNLEQLRAHVSYFALWLLPAFYGAMGAVMYHMRWVLDPLLPHPSLLGLLHRVVLASLAGIVLGWFYTPGSSLEQAATTVGFSLFAFAFLFGFSIDVFFAAMDRFVGFSERAVRNSSAMKPRETKDRYDRAEEALREAQARAGFRSRTRGGGSTGGATPEPPEA